VVRLGFDFRYRTRNQSFAFRSLHSVGFDALGSTQNGAGVADGKFSTFLGQLQWAARLPFFNAQLLSRFDAQLSPDPLLPLEQFAIGGRYSVRGYRENTLVRDNGFAGSIELRVPIYESRDPMLRLEIAPFFDVGRSWNNDRAASLSQTTPKTLSSVGVGARVVLTRWGFGEVYWGHRLKEVADSGESDLQDDGLHFRLSVRWP
jgi:hemolysin activation/secretion protein